MGSANRFSRAASIHPGEGRLADATARRHHDERAIVRDRGVGRIRMELRSSTCGFEPIEREWKGPDGAGLIEEDVSARGIHGP